MFVVSSSTSNKIDTIHPFSTEIFVEAIYIVNANGIAINGAKIMLIEGISNPRGRAIISVNAHVNAAGQLVVVSVPLAFAACCGKFNRGKMK